MNFNLCSNAQDTAMQAIDYAYSMHDVVIRMGLTAFIVVLLFFVMALFAWHLNGIRTRSITIDIDHMQEQINKARTSNAKSVTFNLL